MEYIVVVIWVNLCISGFDLEISIKNNNVLYNHHISVVEITHLSARLCSYTMDEKSDHLFYTVRNRTE